MSTEKVCIECKVTKDIINFRKGHNQCKPCERLKTLCKHGKLKTRCKECGGGSYCVHGRRNTDCKECGGNSICSHGNSKYRCSNCNGISLCPHDPNKKRRKDACKECCPIAFCIHNRKKYECIECEGTAICSHKKRKHLCIECSPKNFCPHKIYNTLCVECKGSRICEHNKRREYCVDCKGCTICPHKKRKHHCIICNPNIACIECKLTYVDRRTTYKPYCQACFCNKFPDHEKSTLYKVKERYLQDELNERLDIEVEMIFDKIVEGGCSKRRPDILIDALTHSIIIECDENQHKNYECENKRMMELFEDLGSRPIVFIRFNPDKYTENREEVEGCFKPLVNVEDANRKRFYDINRKEFERRVDVLEDVIEKNINIVPTKEVTEIKLFYNTV